ncbi:hypothetical protein J3U42_12220, partial [Gilliamella sp. B2923]
LIKDIAQQAKSVVKKYDRIEAQKEVDKNKDALIRAEAEKRYKHLSDEEKAKYASFEQYYSANQDSIYYALVDTQLKTNKDKNLGTMGGDVSKGIDTAMAIVTGVITGDITGSLAGASAPWIAEQIKLHTGHADEKGNWVTDDIAGNLIAHAILGAVVAELQGGPSIAAGGGDTGAAGAAMAAGKNAVENNFMALQVMDEFDRDYRDGLLLFKGDEKAATDYANEMIRDRAIASGVATGIIVGGAVLPNTAIIGGSLSGAINAGMQYTLNPDGSINWTDVGIASGVGAVTGGAGTGFWGTVGWNAAGGATSNYLKDEDPLIGAAASAIGSGFGYLGGKMLQGPLEKLFNPVSKQYEWIPIGIWTITKPASQSSIPAISGGVVDSATGELIDNKINDLMKSK